MKRDFDPTDKQAEILRIVFKAADEGEFISLIDLKEKLSYGKNVSKSAISCSVRKLQIREMVEIVYGDLHEPMKSGMKAYIKPTVAAYKRFRASLVVGL